VIGEKGREQGKETKGSQTSKKSKNPNWNFPKEIMPTHTEYEVDVMLRRGKGRPLVTEGSDQGEECIDESKPPKLARIEPLPVEVIERHKLSLSELKQLPKFKDYSPGFPTQVLFIKNLHPKVSEGDLLALFGSFPGGGGNPPRIQLMKGKMKGQAFVHLECKYTTIGAGHSHHYLV
jgi:hypothetical protein